MTQDSKRELKPKLRFPEFQDAPWIEKPLGAFARLTTERAGNGKCILMSITSGVGLVSQMEKFGRTIAGKQFTNYITLRQNEFAYNKSATKEYPQGFIAMYSGDELAAVPNSIFTCFSVHTERVVPRYLDYLFLGNLHGKWLKKYIEVSARAHGSLSIGDEDLLSLPIPLPSGKSSRAEQHKIADCLTSVDELIAAQARKLDALKTHKQGLMQQLFPREGETQPRLRFPEFQDAGEWEYTPMGNLLMSSPNYGVNAAAVPYSERLPKYLRITDISDEGSYLSDKKVSVDLEPTDGNYLDEGDIALARTGASVGKSYRYRKEDGRLVFAGFLIRVKPDKKRLVSAYLANYLTTWQYWDWVAVTSARSGQPGINSIEYSSLAIPLPPGDLAEQKRVADCLTSLDEMIAAQTQKLDAHKTHKKGLMQQLFPSPEEVEA